MAIVDFTGFEDLIDAVGGVKVNLPHKICTEISGGAGGGQGGSRLRLGKGEQTLDGQQALVYARPASRANAPGRARARTPSATTTTPGRRPSRK